MYRTALIYNPYAGRLRRDPWLLEAVVNRLGKDVRAMPTTGPGMAADLAKEAIEHRAERIVAFGGDGTIHEVANGMIGSRTPLGILPGGTANVLSVELGLGTRVRRSATRLLELKPRRIAVAQYAAANQTPKYFLLMAGVGLDAQIVHTLNPTIKRHLGKAAYWIGGFSSVLRRLPEFEVRIGGETYRASFALASRVRNYGGDLEIAPTVRLHEPEFEVVLFEGAWAFQYLRYFTGVLLKRLDRMPGVTLRRATSVEFPGAGPAQIDGEAAGHTPARIEIVPDALSLLMPDTYR
ncbi:MAG: diacylglycerol kinase family protein [Bryobacteraceae bacterium]|nr:diacylglycerol kinase family protein [Bryobacteraceae bacterium]